MVIGFDSLWVVDGLSYSVFAGSWDLSKSVGIGVVFHGKVCGLGGEHGSGFSMGGLLKERERCG
jgi:hypothetical protein